MYPGNFITHTDGFGIVRRWRVCGIYLGGEGQESVVEIVSISHTCPTADGFSGPWDTEEYELQPGTTILARRSETGACVYLDPQTGCTIYERRRKACRAFSCKVFVENADGAQAEGLAAEHPQFRRVIREGRRRCGPLTPL
jgi:Fe-S-cluster containining protein